MEKQRDYGSAKLFWLVLFVVPALGLMAGGYGYYRSETERIRQAKYQEIAAIAQLKTRQIQQWRQERLGDLSRSAKAPFFVKAIREWIRDPNNAAIEAQLRDRLLIEQKEEAYADVLLLDTEHRVLMSAEPQPLPLTLAAKQAVDEALAGRTAMLSDLYRCPRGVVHMDAVAPILDENGQPFALLILRSNAEALLYPLIQSWLTPSRTAETLLVRKDGDSVLFLNDLRHNPNTALSLREPLTLSSLPAVQAVLGKRGMFQGKDYRGVEVLADLRPIPGSPWFMVAKVDTSEILEEAHYRGGVVGLFAVLFVLFAASATAYGYRYRQVRLYRDLYRSERESRIAHEEFRATLYSIGDAVITTDTRGLVKQMNRVAERLTCWSEAEAKGKPLDEVFRIVNEESRGVVENPVQKVLREGQVIGLANHTLLISKEGTEHPIADSGAPIRDEAGVIMGVVLVFRDQTKERAAEESLRESEARYSDLYENAPDMYVSMDPSAGKIVQCNQTLCRMTGYSEEEIIGRPIFDMYHPDSMEAAKKAFEAFVTTGEVHNAELQLRRKDGSKIDVSLNLTAVRDGSGKILYSRSSWRDITERKRAEEALHASDNLLHSMIDHSESIVWVKDLDGRFLIVNRYAEEALGLSQDQMVGRTVHDFFPDDFAREYTDNDRKVLESGHSFGFEESALLKGKQHTFWSTKIPLRDSAGRIYALGAICNDITARKRAEEALRVSEERYKAIFDNASTGIDVVDGKGRFQEVNDAFAKMLGYSKDELLNLTVFDITNPEDIEVSRAKLDAMMLSEVDSYRFEKRYVKKDGTSMWADVSVSAVRDGDGDHVATVGVISDTTERVQAEAERKRLASAIEQAAEVVVITDAEGDIRYVNPAFHKVTGYTRDEAVGRNPRILKSGQHDTRFYKDLWDTIKAGKIWSGRLINRRKDGSLCHEDATISPVKDTSGNITNFVAVKRDITEHLQLSTQLFQAQKMEAVGTLAGGVAHDFNNLLQVVLGYSELILSDQDLPSQYREDLAKVNHAAKNGADLVQGLLTFSRKTEVKPRPLNLNRRIEQLQKMLSRTISKMIDIEVILDHNLAAINADPTQMEQVLMNLAVNARDAMPEGGRLIIQTENVTLDEHYCKTHLGAKAGRYVLLSVSDTGQGMGEETLQHIFEPFFTTKGPGEGTGLGLAMVYGIVKQHGGHITCYSELSQGTIFKMYFPALVSDEELRDTEIRPLPLGGSETILVVDDEELIRDLAARILTKAGYRVITANNGKKALKVYRACGDEISLVILDLIMPEMGGRQCLESLLHIDPSVRVVIASGYSADSMTKEELASGAKGFVNKPYDMRQVLEVVRSVLDEKVAPDS